MNTTVNAYVQVLPQIKKCLPNTPNTLTTHMRLQLSITKDLKAKFEPHSHYIMLMDNTGSHIQYIHTYAVFSPEIF